jgi:hypothetical protein
MRLREGIDDEDLRDAIGALAQGDTVRITLRAENAVAGETLLVRIVEIDGPSFRGELVGRPTTKCLGQLGVGYAVAFTAAHIHSLGPSPCPVIVNDKVRDTRSIN